MDDSHTPKRESTPRRLLREFATEAAQCYKAGIPSKEGVKPIDLKATMAEYKELWDLSTASLYNTENKVQFMTYFDHLSNTLGA